MTADKKSLSEVSVGGPASRLGDVVAWMRHVGAAPPPMVQSLIDRALLHHGPGDVVRLIKMTWIAEYDVQAELSCVPRMELHAQLRSTRSFGHLVQHEQLRDPVPIGVTRFLLIAMDEASRSAEVLVLSATSTGTAREGRPS